VFTNLGATPCLLRGYPRISAVTPTGVRRVLRPRRGGTYFGRLVPADLPPVGHSFLDFATSTGCAGGAKARVTYRRLVFGLPHGGTLRAGRVSIAEVCGLSMSEFGLPERYSQPAPAAGTVATAEARAEVPAAVRAGNVLHYIVTLANPTNTTITLDPCPGYSEGLYTAGLVVRRSFALNCDSVHAIRAHEHVRYAMRLTVPKETAPGTGKLGWSLNTPSGPSVGRALIVKERK
jgi:hypothetical protein